MATLQPRLAMIIVSGSACSEHYVKNKVKAAKEVFILTATHRFKSNSDTSRTLEEMFLERIAGISTMREQ
jgi:5,10-methylene-tetrahydrofolate dehydrogenase/methenyl tetrahydrofolate cyclohydrolase